jgi:hypothetical protein
VPEFPFLKQIENYNCKISNSNNPSKTTWNIIENETHKKGSFKGIHLNIDGKLTNNYQTIVGSVNTLADKIRSDNRYANNGKLNKNSPLHYLIQAFEHPFRNIIFNYVSTNEI